MHHHAKFNKNWSKGCRDTLYGDLTVYRTAAVCHLGFLKFNFLRSFLRAFSALSAFSALMCLQCFDAVGWAAGRASGL